MIKKTCHQITKTPINTAPKSLVEFRDLVFWWQKNIFEIICSLFCLLLTLNGCGQGSTVLTKLLTHFKENNKLPVVIDSVYMTKVANGDSLGTNEVKMLARFWRQDDLILADSNQVSSFYKIDSMKANHTFTGQYKEGMPTHSNAYALQKIELPGETLLVWALTEVQQEADPIYRITNVYFTILQNHAIGETFIMGRIVTGIDPPEEYNYLFTGSLISAGKLTLEEKEFDGNVDSLTGVIKHTHYEYMINQGNTLLKMKKQDAPVGVKL